ncbi:MAG TPA: FadR/GntR family transcriptional regulator [Bryobacteraceae bacterium]|nr:FadR/GntR family transcriptional regulator [Bryobacteraceae bacterium]
MMLKAVTREQTLTERAQQQFEELIVTGRLSAGDRLPSESEMAKMLGVSRTVVREAVRLLSAKGLVEARSGSGIYVRELNSAMIREPIDLLLRYRAIKVEDILEVRNLMEVHLAGLAAERATPENIAAMEESVAALHNPRLSPREYAEIDVAFHACLAAASGNPLFGILSQSMNAVMLGPIRFAFERTSAARTDTIAEHSLILERVRARDPEGARRAMAESLIDAPRNWGGFPARGAARISPVASVSTDPVNGDHDLAWKRVSSRRRRPAKDGSG